MIYKVLDIVAAFLMYVVEIINWVMESTAH